MSDKYAELKQAAPYEMRFSRLWERYDEACHGNAEQMRDILELALDALETAERHIARSDRDVSALLAERDADKQRIEELSEDAQELIRFKDVMQKASKALNDGNPLNLESLFKGELASAMFAMMFAGEFSRSGATNYLELLYEVPEFGEFTVTIQKVEGNTPGQRIAELEARTLTVKLPPVMRIDEPGVSFNAYGQSGIQNALYEACAAAGISLKIEGE